MELVHFHGLNCYHDCVLSIANDFGLNYADCFSTLWSETDLRYDPYREVYLTKRLISNLGIMGARAECFDCFSKEDVNQYLSLFREGDFMIIGMDAFYIPWNQFYHIFHGPHYFIARYTKTEMLDCVDPTYGRKSERMAYREVIEHTFDICRISRLPKAPLQTEPADEAREIIRTHPHTRRMLLSRIRDCVKAEQEGIILLAKYIDAMICNRYLYRFFLENRPRPCGASCPFLSEDYFLKWKAVKNGLYKASIQRDNGRVIDNICDHFSRLIDDETAMAEDMINGAYGNL